MKTLFLQAPSYDGFDGGAGSRYQAKREVRSFWYPTWLAQPAALVPGSRLLDAPADGLPVADALYIAAQYDLVIMHTREIGPQAHASYSLRDRKIIRDAVPERTQPANRVQRLAANGKRRTKPKRCEPAACARYTDGENHSSINSAPSRAQKLPILRAR